MKKWLLEIWPVALVAIILTIISITLAFYPDKKKLVVIDTFVQVTDPDHGLGIYIGHYPGNYKEGVIFIDTVCIYSMGDTIIPLKIIKQ